MDRPRVLSCGSHAVLVEVAGTPAALRLADRIRAAVAAGIPGWSAVTDIVPAAVTVLVVLEDEAANLEPVRQALALLLESPDRVVTAREPAPPTEIMVDYDGPDLDHVAEVTGLSRAEVVAAHTSAPWTVGFGGFAPGFAYLVGGDPRLRVPRRAQPRTTVPAGAVALAGEYSAIYPRSSPGGWQLIGRTDARVWDLDRDPPALLSPGSEVRFVDRRAC